MEADREMDVVTTEKKEKETTTATTEATAETVGIQAMQTLLRRRTTKATMEASYHHRTINRPQFFSQQ